MSSSRINGISFSRCPVRTYEAIIKHDNHFEIYEKVKQWFADSKNKYKFIIKPRLTTEELFSENKFKKYIVIKGYIEDINLNDNDIFEEVYSFFEYIFIKMEMEELSFYMNSIENTNYLFKIYKHKL